MKREPTPDEVAKYLETHQDIGKWGSHQVDPNLVQEVTEDLRVLYGRDPTAKEVEQFLEDMNQGEEVDEDPWKDILGLDFDQFEEPDKLPDLSEMFGDDEI